MRKVISKDGTPIAFDQSGQGPPSSWWLAHSTIVPQVPHSLLSFQNTSPFSTMIAVVEERVGTGRPMPSSVRSKISQL